MNKKISLGLAISLIIVSITASFAITMAVSKRMYNSLITALPERIAQYDEVAEIDELVRANYYGNIDQNNLNINLADGYIKGLNDRASFFMTAAEYNEYSKMLDGNLPGIGITQTQDAKTGAMYVSEVAVNSPAASEGLKKGDEIVKIGGIQVTKSNYDSMVTKIEGIRLTTVNITYRRGSKENTINVMIGYPAQSVSYEVIGSYGYVKITAFYKNTLDQFNKAIAALQDKKVTKLIFDVRNTSDGSIEYAAQVIDAVVPLATEGTKAIATVTDRTGKVIKTFTSDANEITLPMVVLINANTSGGAELFAQDLKDFEKDNATLVGDTTAGNGSMQDLFRLKDGNAVMLTVAKITPYTSPSYDKIGVVPDVVVKLTPQQDANLDQISRADDAQLNEAFTILGNG